MDQPLSDDPLEAQHWLVETSLALLFAAYDEAVDRGQLAEPVIFLLDCEDPIGGEIARSWQGDDAVNAALAETSTDAGKTTVFAQSFSLADCRREVPAVFPYLASAFTEMPPKQGFWAISVTAGGASLLTVPLSARPAEA